jgi:hypothetical protein
MKKGDPVLSNPLFGALKKVGHEAKDDISVWSQGLGLHNHNLLTALKENVDESTAKKVLKDLWKFFHSVNLIRPNQVLGVEAEPDVNSLNRILTDIMNQSDHPAIMEMGDTVEEAILNWVKTFAIYDFAVYTYLERHLGAKDGLRIYMGLWESFALIALDHHKQALGIDNKTEITMDVIGKLSRAYWESIACPYRITKHSADIHEAEIETCPYWENMKIILGEEKCRSMTLKTEAHTSVNYYDAILKALGVFERYSFTMDKFSCCGDNCCRVRFERRK